MDWLWWVVAVATLLVGLVVTGTLVARRIRLAEARARDLAASLQRQMSVLDGLIANSRDAIAIVARDGEVCFASSAIRDVLGYDPDEINGRSVLDLVHHDLRDGLAAALADGWGDLAEPRTAELQLRHRDGTWRNVEVATRAIADHDRPALVATIRDVGRRQQLEAEIAFRASHDPLTQLTNRARLLEGMSQAIDRSARSGEPFAIALIDLDDFKVVNDNLGHQAGDRLLVAVARRLRARVRDVDLAARLGGDEFALLLEDVTDEASAAEVVDRLLTELREPVNLSGQKVSVSASVGVVVSRGRERGVQELLRDADIAMYAAKMAGKGTSQVFHPQLRAVDLEHLELRADLELAVERDQLVLAYQPIVDLRTGQPVSFEALLRWQHPERGRIAPDDFIPLAEQTRLIVPIGRWVVRTACEQATHWPEPVSVGVNLSSVQIADAQLVQDVADALAITGLAPERLTLELTETAMMHDTERAISVLDDLSKLGVSLAVDDFGTGYSSFNYLNRFALDVLKVDRSFVSVVLDGPEDAAIAKAIVRLGETLDLRVVAEGIEHGEQAELLASWGCPLGQGYWFSPPMPSDVVGRWLQAQAPAVTSE
ncbi:MAG TPA: EAL domain-containing protein [Nitriliruptorales bacterium]